MTWLFRGTIFTVSLIVSLFIAEILLARYWPQDMSSTFRESNADGLFINKRNWQAQHQYAGKAPVTYRLNSDHLRGPEIDHSKKKVLVLGDSFTFGWLLENQDTYVSRLEQFANSCVGSSKYQFLNAGAGGWGTASYLRFIETYGEQIKPDIVMVFLNTADIGRSLKSAFYSRGSKGQLEFHPQLHKVDPIKQFLNSLPFYNQLLERSHLLQLSRKVYVTYKYSNTTNKTKRILVPNQEIESTRIEEGVKLGQALFRRLNDWCHNYSCQLLVTTTGFHESVTSHTATEQFLKTADGFFNELQVPFFDISPLLQQEFDKDGFEQYVIKYDLHPNARASKLITGFVWPWLQDQLSLECKS